MEASDIDGGQEDPEDWEEYDPSRGPFYVHMIAGSCAGVSEHVAVYPFDTLKTHMQVKGGNPQLSAFRTLLKEGGIMPLYRGVSAVFGGCIPAHAAYFSIYEWGKEFFGANRPGHHVLAAFASGGLATTAHDFIMTPLDVVKQRMQLGYYRNVRHCVYSILKTEGFTALWLSLPTTLLLNIPFAGVNVAVNESCKKILNPDGKPSVGTFLISGAIAGGCAAAVTVPLDVIKTRQQTQNVMECPGKFFATVASSEAEALAQPAAGNAQQKTLSSEVVRRQYTGMLSTARQILKEEGWWAFTSGLRVRVLTNAPAVAISWTTYELFKSVLNGALDSSN